MCYCGILSSLNLIQTRANLTLLFAVYIEYTTCYVTNTVYSLVWIQSITSTCLYLLHCIPGLYMMLKALKIKLLLFALQLILTIITYMMLNFNEVTRVSCKPWIVDTMVYSSIIAIVSTILSFIYVIYKEPVTKKEEINNNNN